MMYSIIVAPVMSVEALEQLAECAWLAGHHEKKDRGCFQSDLLDEMAEDDNEIGSFLRGLRVWSEKLGKYVNCFANVNHGEETNTGEADNGKEHTDKFTKGANLRLINYYMTEGETGCLTVIFRGHSFDINVPKGCAVVCCKALLEKCKHQHGAHGRSISIVTEVNGKMPPGASKDEQCEAGAGQAVLPLRETFSPWQPSQPVRHVVNHRSRGPPACLAAQPACSPRHIGPPLQTRGPSHPLQAGRDVPGRQAEGLQRRRRLGVEAGGDDARGRQAEGLQAQDEGGARAADADVRRPDLGPGSRTRRGHSSSGVV